LLRQLNETPGDLRVVTGPEDGASVCSDWVGAVVSVTGRSDCFPALVEAVEDGLLHPGCRHTLVPFNPQNGEAEALFCTKWAVASMLRRRDEGHAPGNGDDAAGRARFIQSYEDAQRAERSGRVEDALQHCQTALRMLGAHDLFGAEQAEIARVLKGRIQSILRAQSDRASTPTAIE
jgi:hypothetical protein